MPAPMSGEIGAAGDIATGMPIARSVEPRRGALDRGVAVGPGIHGRAAVHMFAQLRGAYSLRKRSALWRTVAVLAFAWTALGAFVALQLVVGSME